MTLVEVLIASGILLFGMVAILAVLTTAQRAHIRAVHEATAVQVANSVLTEWRAALGKGQLLDAPDPNTPFEYLPRHRDYPEYRYTVRLVKIETRRGTSNAPPMGEEYYVEVKVYWSQRGDAQSATFATVMLLRHW